MRYLTAGESHGPQLTTILEGFPAQVPLLQSQVNAWLEKRQAGYGRGRRMQIEKDHVEFLSGVRAGRTTGAPITLKIENADHRNWLEIMDVARTEKDSGGEPRKKALTAARPGHADLTGGIKYRHKDLRDVLERASARETASRVAVGAIALQLLEADSSDPEAVALQLEVMLFKRGFKNVSAIVQSEAQMRDLLTLEPFADTRDGLQYVVLLRSHATLELPALPPKTNLELIGVTRDAVFLWGERGLSHDASFVQ